MLLYGLMLLCLPKHVRTVCMHAGQGALAHISVLNTWKYLVEAEAPGISDGLVPPRPTVPLRSLHALPRRRLVLRLQQPQLLGAQLAAPCRPPAAPGCFLRASIERERLHRLRLPRRRPLPPLVCGRGPSAPRSPPGLIAPLCITTACLHASRKGRAAAIA